MDETFSSKENREESPRSEVPEPGTDGHLKDLLVDLIACSRVLDARVWLDGVYTDIGDEQVRENWMNNRDVYFKVEGRVDKRNDS